MSKKMRTVTKRHEGRTLYYHQYDKKGELQLHKKEEGGVGRKVRKSDFTNKKRAPSPNGILHVTVGIDDYWEPTPQELDSILELFSLALDDPNAVIVTRTGVHTEWLTPAETASVQVKALEKGKKI